MLHSAFKHDHATDSGTLKLNGSSTERNGTDPRTTRPTVASVTTQTPKWWFLSRKTEREARRPCSRSNHPGYNYRLNSCSDSRWGEPRRQSGGVANIPSTQNSLWESDSELGDPCWRHWDSRSESFKSVLYFKLSAQFTRRHRCVWAPRLLREYRKDTLCFLSQFSLHFFFFTFYSRCAVSGGTFVYFEGIKTGVVNPITPGPRAASSSSSMVISAARPLIIPAD